MNNDKYFKIVSIILSFMILYFGISGLVSINIYAKSVKNNEDNKQIVNMTSSYCNVNGTVNLSTFNLVTGISYLILAGFCGLLLFGNFVYRKSFSSDVFYGNNIFENHRYIVTIFSLSLVWVFMLIWGVFIGGFSFISSTCMEYNYKYHKLEFIMAMFTIISSLVLAFLGFVFPCVVICRS